MEFLRKTVRVGNSAGVVLPRKLLGSEVKITVVNMPINIKKEVLRLIDDCLENVLGIYITNKKPIEVLVISDDIKKVVEEEKIKVIIVPLSQIKKDMKTNFVLRSKLEKAGAILNKSLLSKIQKEARNL
ncbi:hypothetical protein HYT92_01635 [Candidatus Pacearchaeota archaeon]|nr:hypothetical protein [Candidatus Pacearchaeota archaeon]